ncbi:vitamin K epoxide reductase family protein [Ruicaihuangia caeni]|uniref:Vitamin K epoxide reductase family protein n=1 Tax=Ruicaihuangia caeni TaxID=3042517 RepID=A0AAW6T6C1_9MICO|nr:vitamin K epoxide reductase family protein [Klugiella sp. YN-L-19]MDI2097903.1 vitamin K epoxide reductase family protein [Klugiella sp. YN-L-19]
MGPEAAASTRAQGGGAALTRLAIAWVVLGAVAFVASMILAIDRYRLLADPNTELGCDISPFVACGPVMESPAGALFGFPNPLLGVACFMIMITSGMALLAGARLRPWFWIGMQIGLTLAGVFITWLQTQTLYVIESLCIWCMVVWAMTIPLIVLTTAHALAYGRFGNTRGRRLGRWMQEYRWMIIVLWYLVVILAIALKFYREFALMWFGVAL